MSESPAAFEHALPPSSVDAERAVVGALLQSVAAATLAAELLRAEDFYSPEFREIYSAMMTLHQSGRPIDLMTVTQELTRRGTLEGVGGSPALMLAFRYVPSAANARYYMDIVAEKATLRRLIEACARITTTCYQQQLPLEELLSGAEREIFDIVMKRATSDSLMPLARVLGETYEKINTLSQLKGRLAGVPTGFFDLDRMLTCLHGGELALIGARPAMGKTSVALGVAQFAAANAGMNVALFSLEMPADQLGMRLMSSESRVNMQRLRTGMIAPDEWVTLGTALETLSSAKMYVDDTPGITPAQLRSRCRRLMMEKGLDLIVLDYLQLMGSDKHTENRQNEVSEISRQLKGIALELRVPVLACAQLSRANAARENKRPMLNDLRDSGSIEQDADIVIFVHREGYYAQQGNDGADVDDTKGELIVAKQRNGPVGTVEVAWQSDFVRYANLPGTVVPLYQADVRITN